MSGHPGLHPPKINESNLKMMVWTVQMIFRLPGVKTLRFQPFIFRGCRSNFNALKKFKDPWILVGIYFINNSRGLFFSMVGLNYRGMLQFPYHLKENLCKQIKLCSECLQHHYAKVEATNWQTILSPLGILKNPLQTNLVTANHPKNTSKFYILFYRLIPRNPKCLKTQMPPPQKKKTTS